MGKDWNSSNEFKQLKLKYPGVELAKLLIVQYCKFGYYEPIEEMYKVSRVTIRNYIYKYEKEVKEDVPYMWDMYNYTLQWNKENPGCASKKYKEETQANEDKRVKFTEDLLNDLPKELEYTNLIGKFNLVNTEDLTGNDILNMALRRGIKVYEFDVYTGSKKYYKA